MINVRLLPKHHVLATQRIVVKIALVHECGAIRAARQERNLLRHKLIEHLRDPRAALRQVHRKLSPQGVLVIDTPNRAGWDYWLFRKRFWGGYHIPRHFHLFNLESLARVLESEGYAVLLAADGKEAIAHLEALRGKGATHLVFPSTAFWWLEHYADFRRHLEDRFGLVMRPGADCNIVELKAANLFAALRPPATGSGRIRSRYGGATRPGGGRRVLLELADHHPGRGFPLGRDLRAGRQGARERIYLVQASRPVAIDPFPKAVAPVLVLLGEDAPARFFRLPADVQYQRLVAAADADRDGRSEVLLESTFMNMGE